MKKLLAMFMALVLVLSLVGCTGNEKEEEVLTPDEEVTVDVVSDLGVESSILEMGWTDTWNDNGTPGELATEFTNDKNIYLAVQAFKFEKGDVITQTWHHIASGETVVAEFEVPTNAPANYMNFQFSPDKSFSPLGEMYVVLTWGDKEFTSSKFTYIQAHTKNDVKVTESPKSESQDTQTSESQNPGALTWSIKSDYSEALLTGDAKLEVMGIKDLTADDIEALGFSKPEEDKYYEFKMLDVEYTIQNAKIKGAKEKLYFDVFFGPDIAGIKTDKGTSMVGAAQTYGFEGSLTYNFRDELAKKYDSSYSLMFDDDSDPISVTVRGLVVVSVEKGIPNFLWVNADNKDNSYEDNQMLLQITE